MINRHCFNSFTSFIYKSFCWCCQIKNDWIFFSIWWKFGRVPFSSDLSSSIPSFIRFRRVSSSIPSFIRFRRISSKIPNFIRFRLHNQRDGSREPEVETAQKQFRSKTRFQFFLNTQLIKTFIELKFKWNVADQ